MGAVDDDEVNDRPTDGGVVGQGVRRCRLHRPPTRHSAVDVDLHHTTGKHIVVRSHGSCGESSTDIGTTGCGDAQGQHQLFVGIRSADDGAHKPQVQGVHAGRQCA